MPDVILFDLFGVIARPQSAPARGALEAVADATAPTFWDVYWRLRPSYDNGQVSGTEYWLQVATELGATFDGDRIAALIAADIASWSSVDADMIQLIEHTAAAGVRLALLSNIPEELASHYERHHARWLRHFELVAFSCRIGHAKPDPAAFLWCCDKLDLTPDDVLFVDDRAENVHAAERLGMRAHRFTGPARTAQAISQTRRGSGRPTPATG
ncbi:HAD family hydrolase [Micromonospora echinospora]|uniref:HAD family hydrolase n=1 Tax=Micromonospora echinospora TaxID=1877 RepID=UPI00366E2898